MVNADPNPDGHTPQVLIVDPDPVERSTLAALMEPWADRNEAASLAEARSILSQSPVVLLIGRPEQAHSSLPEVTNHRAPRLSKYRAASLFYK